MTGVDSDPASPSRRAPFGLPGVIDGLGVAPDAAFDVISTARGGADTTRAIIAGGALLGFQSGDVEPPFGRVEFIDWDFKRGSRVGWARHRALTEKHRPRYVVAPDIQGDTDPEWVLEKAAELAQFAETVIIPAKSVHPREIPGQYRVGVPFSSTEWSGGTTFPLEAYRGRPLHILGGDPNRVYTTFIKPFAEQVRQSPYRLRSYDSSRPYLIAEKGEVWDPEHNRVTRPDLALYERMALTVANMVAAYGTEPVQNFEQVLQSGRVPPALPPDMDETPADEPSQFERVMGETVREFRRGTLGPLAMDEFTPPPPSEPQPDVVPRGFEQRSLSSHATDLETFAAQEGAVESVARPDTTRSTTPTREQSSLDAWIPTSEGEQRVKDAIEDDTDTDTDTEQTNG